MVAEGHEVVILDDLSSGSTRNVEAHLTDPEVELVRADFADARVLSEILPGSDVVVHLAAIVSVAQSVADPESTFRVNTEGTARLLAQCVKAKVKKFIFASSAAVYGDSRPPLNEALPCRPLSPYASSKVAGEAYCGSFQGSYGLETVVLRFMNVYGPRGRGGPYSGVMTKFAEALRNGEALTIYGDGRQTRDFVHVSDVVSSVAAAVMTSAASGEIMNIGSGAPTSINALARLFVSASGSKLPVQHAPPRKAEVRASFADISRARRVLGYSPRVALAKGVEEYLEWHRVQSKPAGRSSEAGTY
jgi:UDP-glucose 4-epimerase